MTCEVTQTLEPGLKVGKQEKLLGKRFAHARRERVKHKQCAQAIAAERRLSRYARYSPEEIISQSSLLDYFDLHVSIPHRSLRFAVEAL